jgi:hypothetical protein
MINPVRDLAFLTCPAMKLVFRQILSDMTAAAEPSEKAL